MNSGILKKILLFIFCGFLAFVLLIMGLTYFNKNSNTKDITMKRFEQLMTDGNVKDVSILINKRIVAITLTENALRKQRIVEELNRNQFASVEGPHYQITVFSLESFKKDFEDIKYTLEATNPSKQLGLRVVERQEEIWPWLLKFGFFFLTAFSLPISYFLFVAIGLIKLMKGRFNQQNDKLTWAIIIIFVPIIGFILFMRIGRKQMIT